MTDFISEPITPFAGTFDTAPMGRGEPGLPTGFTWRNVPCTIRRTLSSWKESTREGGTDHGELYLRRHCFKLLMSDDSTWTIYFTRQTPKSGSARSRWFLYTIEHG